jgi:hypothetical protein
MISRILLSGSMAILLAATTPSVFAATIATDYTKITQAGDYKTNPVTPGQSYSKTIDLTGIDYKNTTGVTLELTAKGDYGSSVNPTTSTTPHEWFTFKLDDTIFADKWGTNRGVNVTYSGFSAISGPTITLSDENNGGTKETTDDFVMTAIFSISDGLFQSLAADGKIIVNWQNGPEVDPYHGVGKDAGEDYVQWRLSGNVAPIPIPAAVWLFISGLIGIAGLGRKAQTAA